MPLQNCAETLAIPLFLIFTESLSSGGLKEFTCEERLTQLIHHRLEERRLRGYLFETFKLLTMKENIDPDQIFNINLNNLRGHSKKINKQQCMKLSRCRFFSERC